MSATDPNAPEPGRRRLRLLSYNVQVGISGTRPHHYVTQSWKHVLPHSRRFHNLDRIAELVSDFDIVGLQEVDAGSHRTGHINLTEYLAEQAEFSFWHHQINRDFAGIARHANGLLSRYRPAEIIDYRLPGFIPGRGALMARYGQVDAPIVVLLLHLALGRRARLRQLEYVVDLVNRYEHVVVMGDMNCAPGSREMAYLFEKTRLREPLEALCTFPSWRPIRHIDHILVTPSLTVSNAHVIQQAYSDHLPIAMDIALPEEVRITAQ